MLLLQWTPSASTWKLPTTFFLPLLSSAQVNRDRFIMLETIRCCLVRFDWSWPEKTGKKWLKECTLGQWVQSVKTRKQTNQNDNVAFNSEATASTRPFQEVGLHWREEMPLKDEKPFVWSSAVTGHECPENSRKPCQVLPCPGLPVSVMPSELQWCVCHLLPGTVNLEAIVQVLAKQKSASCLNSTGTSNAFVHTKQIVSCFFNAI